MVLTNSGIAHSAPQSAASAVASARPNGALAAILPFFLILA